MKLLKAYLGSIMVLLFVTAITGFYVTGFVSKKQNYSETDLAIAAINYLSGTAVYIMFPPALATVEHILNQNITYGDCRVKNLIATPTGILVVGLAKDKNTGKTEPHLRGYTRDGEIIDPACPSCDFIDVYFLIDVDNYSVVNQKFIKPNLASVLSYFYTRTALIIQKIKHF